MKVFLFLVLLTTQILAVKNEVVDTSKVLGFSGTDTVYSKTFNLTDAENLTITVFARDSTTVGLSNDSIHFYWWIELGHLSGSTPVWDLVNPIFVDTFNISVAARRVITFRDISAEGSYSNPVLTIDTASAPGWATQRRPITLDAAGIFRIGHAGKVLNNADAALELLDLVWRRAYNISR